MWHPYSRKQSGCLALRTNGTTPLKRPRRRRGPRPPAPAPAPSRGARRRPSARRRTASAARGGRARREPEAKSQRPPCVASCRTRSAAAQAGGAARGARDHIKAASGGDVPPRPRFSSSASRTRRRRPARSTTADSARPAALRHRTEWRKKPRGPYDEWRTRAAAPLPSLVATVMHFIPVVPRRRDGADAAVLFQAFPSPDDAVEAGTHTIRTFNYH